jgi:hypothetical protein
MFFLTLNEARLLLVLSGNDPLLPGDARKSAAAGR